jgi:NADH:ubiquinone oxidoreductase subunit E
MGTACYVRGSKNLVTRLEEILKIGVGETTENRLFSLDIARCIGACGLAPAIMIGEKVYKQVSTAKLGSILAAYEKAEADEGGAVS